jgi:hypothetical protein
VARNVRAIPLGDLATDRHRGEAVASIPLGPRTWLAAVLSAAFLAACDSGSADNQRTLERYPETRLEAFSAQVDAARKRLWVLRVDGVYVYDATNRPLIGRLVLPEWIVAGENFNCAPDLALHPSGTAVVSSNAVTVLWQIDPERFEVRQNELALDADRDKDVGFTGLAFVDGLLFGVDGMHGSLWKIDLAAAKAQKVVLSSPLQGACGLASYPNTGPDLSHVLCVIGETRVRRIELSPDFARGNVTDQACP